MQPHLLMNFVGKIAKVRTTGAFSICTALRQTWYCDGSLHKAFLADFICAAWLVKTIAAKQAKAKQKTMSLHSDDTLCNFKFKKITMSKYDTVELTITHWFLVPPEHIPKQQVSFFQQQTALGKVWLTRLETEHDKLLKPRLAAAKAKAKAKGKAEAKADAHADCPRDENEDITLLASFKIQLGSANLDSKVGPAPGSSLTSSKKRKPNETELHQKLFEIVKQVFHLCR